MENKTESNREIEQGIGKYLGLNFIRAPIRNHDVMTQIGQPFVEWFKKNGVRLEIYYLSGITTSEQNGGTAPEGLESIANKLSTGEYEELWVLLQFYRDEAHANEVYSKIMQDENTGRLLKEFDGLVTKGSNLIMGGFNHVGM